MTAANQSQPRDREWEPGPGSNTYLLPSNCHFMKRRSDECKDNSFGFQNAVSLNLKLLKLTKTLCVCHLFARTGPKSDIEQELESALRPIYYAEDV